MFSINREVRDHVIGHIISAVIFSKRYANEFFERVEEYFKERIIIYKSYRYKT